MVSVKELREKCKKSYWGIWNRLVHEVGFYFTKPFVNTPITSNQITIFWLTLGLVAGLLLSTGTYKWMLLGIILYHIGHFFDCVDGNLARYRNKSTFKGIYLEQISHHITIIAVLIGLIVGVFKIFNNFLWLYAGIIMVFSFVFSKLFTVNLFDYHGKSREKVEEIIDGSNPRVRNKLTTFIFAFVRFEHPLNLMFFLILFNLPHIALLVYTLLLFLEMSQKLIMNLVKLHGVDKERSRLEKKSLK